MNPRTNLAIIVFAVLIFAVAIIITFIVLTGLGFFQPQNAFQHQFDPQMVVCFRSECAWLDVYPDSEGGMVANAMNWLLLIEPDGTALLRHGYPHWKGTISIQTIANHKVIVFTEKPQNQVDF